MASRLVLETITSGLSSTRSRTPAGSSDSGTGSANWEPSIWERMPSPEPGTACSVAPSPSPAVAYSRYPRNTKLSARSQCSSATASLTSSLG